MSPQVDAAQAARAALVVLEDSPPGVLAAEGLVLEPDQEVAVLLEVGAAPLPAQAPREHARPGGVLVAVLGLLVLGVFVGLPLLVVAGAVLGAGAAATAVTAVLLVTVSVALRVLLGRVCSSVPLRERTMVPTLRGRRRRTRGRRAHARDRRDQVPTAP